MSHRSGFESGPPSPMRSGGNPMRSGSQQMSPMGSQSSMSFDMKMAPEIDNPDDRNHEDNRKADHGGWVDLTSMPRKG